MIHGMLLSDVLMIILLKELHFVASNCGEEVIAMEAKRKADNLTPEGLNVQLILHTYSIACTDGCCHNTIRYGYRYTAYCLII